MIIKSERRCYVIMKVLKWIALIWTVLGIPYIEDFYGLLYIVLIIAILAKNLYDQDKDEKESRQVVEQLNKTKK